MIVARLVIRYSANIYLAAICMRPNSRAGIPHGLLVNFIMVIVVLSYCLILLGMGSAATVRKYERAARKYGH